MKHTENWRGKALCQGTPAPFFGGHRTEQKAKQICNACPVKKECLTYALQHPRINGYPIKGIWGGLNSTEIQNLARKREQHDTEPDYHEADATEG